ncbi:MAG: cytochrome c [Betaproteobacteria bacterium]|nr:MAG: cytochrome c [Betaproteobacteria bacterium]
MQILSAAVLGLAALPGSSALADSGRLDSRRAQELVRLVRQDCGSCHGLRLRGGLGPALVPEALRDKPEESLRYTILLGRPGTAMPPWNAILSEAEVDWILDRLLSGFPEEERR